MHFLEFIAEQKIAEAEREGAYRDRILGRFAGDENERRAGE